MHVEMLGKLMTKRQGTLLNTSLMNQYIAPLIVGDAYMRQYNKPGFVNRLACHSDAKPLSKGMLNHSVLDTEEENSAKLQAKFLYLYWLYSISIAAVGIINWMPIINNRLYIASIIDLQYPKSTVQPIIYFNYVNKCHETMPLSIHEYEWINGEYRE